MSEAEANPRLTGDLETTLRRYVLGNLEESLRAELEELLIADPQAFEALGVVEDELVEEYLDGLGSPADRQAFERNFLTSPQREARLRFARALRERASRATAAFSQPALPVVVARPPRWQPAWIGLAAMLAVSLAGNVWLASRHRAQTAGGPSALSRVEGPGPGTPERVPPFGSRLPVEDEDARQRELQEQLERERGERARAEARADALQETVRRSRASVARFALAAGALRAGGAIRRFAVPRDAAVVQLRLELAGADYPQYRASLLDAEGDEVWSASRLKAEAAADEIAVVLTLPAALLPRGDYQVKLSGLTAGAGSEAVGAYAFRVGSP